MNLNDMSVSQSINISHPMERTQNSDSVASRKGNTNVTPSLAPTTGSTEMKSFHELKRAEQHGEIVPISDEQLVKAIQKAIKAAEGITTTLEFSVHKATHLISVKVLDKETGEIIREIPPEKNLDFLAALWRKAGILIDEKR